MQKLVKHHPRKETITEHLNFFQIINWTLDKFERETMAEVIHITV